jgi:hypothetical protein
LLILLMIAHLKNYTTITTIQRMLWPVGGA